MAAATATNLDAPSQTAPQAADASTSTQFAPVNIGTRNSTLAQIQARAVAAALKSAHPERTYNICPVVVEGDRDKITPLQQLSQGENAKSLWTGELETMLEKGDLDIIVHCLKDMPTQLPDNLELGAILEREDPRDALLISPRLPGDTTLATLPQGATIGTSSVRRAAQLRRLYPHLQFADLRGNVGTRLGKLDKEDSPYSAIILAAAGLRRMGLESRITQYLDSATGGMLHAVGQGALAIEIRKDDETMKALLNKIACERTTRACSAERALLRALEGGCSVPIGIETSWRGGKGLAVGAQPAKDYDKHGNAVEEAEPDLDDQELVMKTMVVSVDGKDAVEHDAVRKVRSKEEAEEMGREVAKILIEKGADQILKKINVEKQWAAKKQLEELKAKTAS
ncbi:hydroxymethylbilane synthase [Parastagonospora nodorum]|nr:hydroxymethylbilane synthase [Parastagonospora nodorum]KAH3974392.1 hydroxymethylbilane synthase [Parastagonospora nodorum]KAH4103861.1 hydroxymethylbilane synthase [Parastagonospora nodorum]KAH4117638.1 hydroxymethylbilane synthase [Parastagonospora nodorum]KAH4185218.1 hydroxymethylbilane synthase [Parastagonospora nodorum]